jgi:hypothetical protein
MCTLGSGRLESSSGSARDDNGTGTSLSENEDSRRPSSIGRGDDAGENEDGEGRVVSWTELFVSWAELVFRDAKDALWDGAFRAITAA